jgi:hypothetical protein
MRIVQIKAVVHDSTVSINTTIPHSSIVSMNSSNTIMVSTISKKQ